MIDISYEFKYVTADRMLALLIKSSLFNYKYIAYYGNRVYRIKFSEYRKFISYVCDNNLSLLTFSVENYKKALSNNSLLYVYFMYDVALAGLRCISNSFITSSNSVTKILPIYDGDTSIVSIRDIALSDIPTIITNIQTTELQNIYKLISQTTSLEEKYLHALSNDTKLLYYLYICYISQGTRKIFYNVKEFTNG